MPTQVVASHHDAVVISKDRGTRYGIPAVLGVLLLLALLVSVLGPIFDPHSNVNSPQMTGMMYVVTVISVLVSIGCLGPSELRLDPHSRRYRFTSGLPFFARTREGPYEEIAAIVIRPYSQSNDRRPGGNKLEIDWAVPGRRTSYVCWISVPKSYEVRDDIQKKAGLPVTWES